MSWALKRQLSILLILTLFIGGFVGFFFWLRKPALTCTDGLQNQLEDGIDCGGPCENFCPNTINDPIIKWSRVSPVRAGQYDAVAFIENPNPNAGLAEFEYTFRLYDAANKPVSERSGKTFLNPGEKFALYEPNVSTGNIVPIKAFLELKKPYDGFLWKKVVKAAGELPNLTIRSKQFDVTSGSRVLAVIANTSLSEGRNIQLVVILYDAEGNVIGSSSTFLDVVNGSTELPVVFTWPNSFKEAPASYEIYLHYDQGIGTIK